MKAYRWSRSIVPVILDIRRLMVNLTPKPLYPRGKKTVPIEWKGI
jgi:hypothetical protein